MLKGFKEFISRGNVIDMAVGVVMGSAVTAIVNSIVDNLINPLIAALISFIPGVKDNMLDADGKIDLSRFLSFTINGTPIKIGAVLGAIVNFLLIAVAIYFCIVVPFNKFRELSEEAAKKVLHKEGEEAEDAEKKAAEEKEEKKDAEEKAASDKELELLAQIRDLLAAGKADEAASAADDAAAA